jgi:hypothetical protein
VPLGYYHLGYYHLGIWVPIGVYSRFTEKQEISLARQLTLLLIGGLVGAVVPAYIGPYLQNRITGRDHLASALASYYTSAASEFYAQQALNKADHANINKSRVDTTKS